MMNEFEKSWECIGSWLANDALVVGGKIPCCDILIRGFFAIAAATVAMPEEGFEAVTNRGTTKH